MHMLIIFSWLRVSIVHTYSELFVAFMPSNRTLTVLTTAWIMTWKRCMFLSRLRIPFYSQIPVLLAWPPVVYFYSVRTTLMLQKRKDFEKADPVPQSMFTVATQKWEEQEEARRNRSPWVPVFVTVTVPGTLEDTVTKQLQSKHWHIPVLQAHVLQYCTGFGGRSRRCLFCSQVGK